VNPIRRSTALVLIGALALVSACGSEDAASSGSIELPSTPNADGPNATIAADIPDYLIGQIGPVEVIGDSLPLLTTQDFTADPAVGMAAPVLVGLGYDGETVRIDAAADGPTMVVFLAHWCPHCNAEIPVINSLRDDDRVPPEVNVVAVSTDVRPGQPNFPPGKWLDDKEWTYPALVDGVDMENERYIAASAFGLNGYPFITLIDTNGIVVARWSGERPASEIASLLAALPNVA
jgi:cytochrome c biogenesis protein CcmG/thiol:disulfide interchange protein DsbE